MSGAHSLSSGSSDPQEFHITTTITHRNGSDVEKSKGTEVISEIIEIHEDETHDYIEGDPSLMTNSPYPEVRAAVSTEIDPDINLFHWRAFLLTTILVILFAGVNQFFSLRYPSLTISYVVGLIIVYPVGKALEKLPDIRFKYAPFFNLNPGPFSTQEHSLIVIVLSVTSSSAYAMNILLAQAEFYKQDLSPGYQILLVLSSQLLGLGASYNTRRWIVEDHHMTWPQNLVTATVLTTIRNSKLAENIHIPNFNVSRYRLFLYLMIFSFVFYFIPGFLFQATSLFNWICWINKDNIVVNQIFGTSSGLGIFPITLDWTMITQALSISPLATPFFATANIYASVFIFFIIVLPCLYYTNVFYAKYLPMISTTSFDNKQQTFNVTRLLKGDRIDVKEYKEYSPLFLPYSYLLSYALNFAAISAVFVHTALYNGKSIWGRLKNPTHGGEDIHVRLYKKHFKQIPWWWAVLIFLISLGLAFATVSGYSKESKTSPSAVVLLVAVSLVFFIPQGVLEGITNQHVGLNVLSELIAGYVYTANPFANMIVKLYLFITMRFGLDISRDQKLAVYMKVPPRTLFFYQIFFIVLAALVNVGVQIWMLHNVNDICVAGTEFSCPGGKTIFYASITFSLVQELFSIGKRYNVILWFFLIGAILPVISYLLKKKYPRSWVRYINFAIFFTGSGNIPPSTVFNYTLFFLTGFFFNYVLKKYKPNFHLKYNYVISAAFDCGVAISAVVIFLCISYPGGKLDWWGNNVQKNTKDFEAAPFYTLKSGETFGPKTW